MNESVRIIIDEDGTRVDKPTWCAYTFQDGSYRTLCSGQAFGFGESSAKFDLKRTYRGGITCQGCLHYIKEIKSIKL